MLLSVSAGTQHTYQTGWNVFCTFRHSQATPTLPASVEEVRDFVAWMSLKGLSPRTIATYVAGVAFYHKIRDWPDPTHDFVVSKLLAGCRRDRQSQDTREPLSLSVLLQAISNLSHTCASQYEAVMFRAAMLCAFFGFMRIGEFVAVSRHRLQDSRLMRQGVHVNDSYLHAVLVVFRSETQRIRGDKLNECVSRNALIGHCVQCEP